MPGHFAHSPDSLEHYLSDADGAGRLIAHVRLLQKLARFYESLAPAHLCAASRVANYKSGTVVIHADNGAVAVKLRQLAPTLTREFSNRGIECTGVTVKVQAIEIPRHSSQHTARPLSATTSRGLAELAESLPQSSLRAAIETLLERSLRTE